MNSAAIHILLVEDDEDDYILTKGVLEEVFPSGLSLSWVCSIDEALPIIQESRPDIGLVDYRLGATTGLDFIEHAREQVVDLTMPFILLTGVADRKIDIEAMRAGASDYLVKQELSAPLLERAIRYAIERKKAEVRLKNVAQHDSLTGLPNRVLFHERIADGIAQAKRAGQILVLLSIDLDKFKEVNDTLGHPVGDALLKEVSSRILASVRDTDTVARLGGDEFAVIATQLQDKGAAVFVADKITRALAEPYLLGDETVDCSGSVGVALYPEDGVELGELMRHADQALYQSKHSGRSTYTFFDAELESRSRLKKLLLSDIKTAIQASDFDLLYQPILAAETRECVGVEVLFSWTHPEAGNISPRVFLSLAETSGSNSELIQGALAVTIQCWQRWRAQGLPPLAVSLNASAAMLAKDTIAISIVDNMLMPSLIDLQLDERSLVSSNKEVREALRRLHAQGVKITLDNFGRDAFSFACISELVVTQLKIDQDLIHRIPGDLDAVTTIKAILALAETFDLTVVGSGIETAEQMAILQHEGCDFAQGDYLCPPLLGEDFSDWYRATYL